MTKMIVTWYDKYERCGCHQRMHSMWLMAPTRLQKNNYLGRSDLKERKKVQNIMYMKFNLKFKNNLLFANPNTNFLTSFLFSEKLSSVLAWCRYKWVWTIHCVTFGEGKYTRFWDQVTTTCLHQESKCIIKEHIYIFTMGNVRAVLGWGWTQYMAFAVNSLNNKILAR